MSSFVTPYVAPSDIMRQTLNEFFDTSDHYDMANQTRAMRPRRRMMGGEQGSFMNLNCMETDKAFMVHCEVRLLRPILVLLYIPLSHYPQLHMYMLTHMLPSGGRSA